VFPGHERELSALRRWLAELLPPCAARDDVAAVATELASNALKHTRSGRGGWFGVEVTWHPQAERVAVADRGGPSAPRVIDDPVAEHGRGLLLVRGLSVRTGTTGDRRGRLVWADVAWPEHEGGLHAPDPQCDLGSAGQYTPIRPRNRVAAEEHSSRDRCLIAALCLAWDSDVRE
jgi:hypothetical protein